MLVEIILGKTRCFHSIKYREDDVLGLSCDMVNKTVSFSVNDSFEPSLGVAFDKIVADFIAPVLSVSSFFKVVTNLGHLTWKHTPTDETYVSVHDVAQK